MNINSLFSALTADQTQAAKPVHRTSTHANTQSATNNQDNFAETLAKATAKTPAKELEAYLAMSDAERYMHAWLKQHGMSKESFDALPAAEKQQLTQKMQQDLKQHMEDKMRAKVQTSPDNSQLATLLFG